MQRSDYDRRARSFTGKDQDKIVGNYRVHDAWEPYNKMIEGFDTHDMICLDFGCGPGRNILKYGDDFKRIDGVDISKVALNKANEWLDKNGYKKDHKLILCNGVDLTNISDESYDLVHSTITLQHICVHDIRYNYFQEFHRVIRSGGWITIQMGYNDIPVSDWKKTNHRMRKGVNLYEYYENAYSATGTNGRGDVYVDNQNQIKSDLEKIGFTDFSYFITASPHPDINLHPKQIYFRAKK